ncbi:HAMP domain-containing histidine kinase [Candidatus Microgenomates bacterium]|nr:HAMP domain-containing histidine kinase [Candidatus Microgenomates bacterium]
MVNDVYTSSVRLIGLVNDFLNMSRLEQGRMVYKKETFDMSTLVEEVVKEYTIAAAEKKLYLKADLAPGFAGAVFADRSKVKEVLINFIGNALKFTPTGGITIHLSQEMNVALVRVQDTGKGIPRDNQALLFRKFQQAGKDIYARDMSQGSGLGLYISKLMMQGMGGTIGLENSVPEQGSVFFFSLPLAKEVRSGTIKK